MIKLKDAPKIGNGCLSRAAAPQDTYRRIQPLMPAAGLSHLVEITALDVLDIPIFTGFGSGEADHQLQKLIENAPDPIRSKMENALAGAERFPIHDGNSHQPIFVAGKGSTSLEAKVSAMMEAIERFSARNPSSPPTVATFRELRRKADKVVLDPRSLVLQSPTSFDLDQPLEWVTGTQLDCLEEVWVPADAATLSYRPRRASRICSDTPTGLGAGNTLEEAISHGLAEAIEHDSWTLAIVRSSIASAQNGILDILFGRNQQPHPRSSLEAKIEEEAFIQLTLDSFESHPLLSGLIDQIQKAGVEISINWIYSDIRVPTCSVSLAGMAGGQDGGGLGTHPDARVAVSRAITEAAQQRLVLGAQAYFPTAQPISRWQSIFWENTAFDHNAVRFEDIESFQYGSILEDIHHMMDKLAEQGLEQVIVVDLTKPEFNMPVVKVIVPGLADYWTGKSAPDWEALGPRVQRYLD